MLTTRVCLLPDARLAAVVVSAAHRRLPAAVRVVDHDVGVAVSRHLAGRPCGEAVCCRTNVYRHLDDLIALARLRAGA